MWMDVLHVGSILLSMRASAPIRPPRRVQWGAAEDFYKQEINLPTDTVQEILIVVSGLVFVISISLFGWLKCSSPGN